MAADKRMRLIFPMAVLVVIANAVAWSQPAPQRQPNSINGAAARNSSFSASRARDLEAKIQQIAPSRTMVAVPPAATPELRVMPTTGQDGNASAPVATVEPLVTLKQVATPPAQSTRPRNVLQYVRTGDAALERDIAQAVVSQQQLRGSVEDSGAITPLPGILRYTDNAGTEVQLKGFAITARRLVYDATQRRYRGSIMLGLTDIVPGRPARELSTPVVFQVIGADTATPSQVRVTRTNPPYPEIELVLASARPVRVFSDAIADSIEIDVPLDPTVTVEAGSAVIDGLGLGATQINISVAGLDRPEGRIVRLQTDGGYLEPTLVRLDAQGSGSATLRSDGIRGARIVARTQGIEPSETVVDFRPPYLTFFASLIGGLVGGVIRGRGRSRGLTLLVAALSGLLVFALYAVGINVLPFALTPSVTVGAAFVFAISGLGGFFGPSLLRGRASREPAHPPAAEPAAAS